MRCKFKVDSITRRMGSAPVKNEEGTTQWLPTEMWDVSMSPVYANGDPAHENSKFWQATPSGSFTVGTVNKSAVERLELGAEYYIDITPALGNPPQSE